ncbi:MAG: hypothetical protein AVDCRST_MAG18-1073 [uncultured Thermomicrobiales bacterium]|uniref:Mobile element protein n=1 Tax=uncultured Thermomicrobiales bacterium TaxID=1645740 RepID=A0A6J4UUN9_9BACT|nr:MAG: hypothetical protein AVDCRST_MAG18-1073 [uncultured Thermomicrobiales bacterium]
MPAIERPSGQRRKRPGKPHADKGYDDRRCRGALRGRHSEGRIAREGVARSDRLGRPPRAPRRSPPGLPHAGALPHLPPLPREGVVKRALKA